MGGDAVYVGDGVNSDIDGDSDARDGEGDNGTSDIGDNGTSDSVPVGNDRNEGDDSPEGNEGCGEGVESAES